MTKINLGRKYDNSLCEVIESSSKQTISYPSLYISGIDLKSFKTSDLGSEFKIKATVKLKSIEFREKSGDSMSLEFKDMEICADSKKEEEKDGESLQNAIEEGLKTKK